MEGVKGNLDSMLFKFKMGQSFAFQRNIFYNDKTSRPQAAFRIKCISKKMTFDSIRFTLTRA